MAEYCPFCNNESTRYFSIGDLNQELSRKRFDYYRCQTCGLIFLSPIPSDLSCYYQSSYAAYQKPDGKDLNGKAEQERYKLEIVQSFITSGRLLEIGPGYGGFAFLAKQAGFEVETIEMDPCCCQFLSEVIGVRAINAANVCDAMPDIGSYDVIALWHVLEHLIDPWSTLHELAGKLQPGGIIVIATPNPASLQFRIFGRFWTHVDAPRHLELIPMELLIKRMESLGLKSVLATTSDKASTIFSTFGWWRISLKNIWKAIPSLFSRRNKSYLQPHVDTHNDVNPASSSTYLLLVRKLLFSPFIALDKFKTAILRFIFSYILKPIERTEGLGCAYTTIFKKVESS